MRAGGGKQKGASFEREICKKLSLWVSGGKREDLFWRSAMSGGRATVGKRRGADMAAHAGDISATHEDGHVLTNAFYAECKNVKDLRFDSWILKDEGLLAQFWRVAQREAAAHGKMPMLIAKQNLWPTILILPIGPYLTPGPFRYAINPHAMICRVFKAKAEVFLFDEVMLRPFEGQAIKDLATASGPMLTRTEAQRIFYGAAKEAVGEGMAKRMLGVHDKPLTPEEEADTKRYYEAVGGKPLITLGLQSNVHNLLTSAGIISVEQVKKASDADLLRLPNFGRKALNDVRAALKRAAWKRGTRITLLRAAPYDKSRSHEAEPPDEAEVAPKRVRAK